MKKILAILAIVYFGMLLGFGLNNAKASYTTDGSVSNSSELSFTILPTIEQTVLADQTWQTPIELKRQINIGVRANFNNWALDYQIIFNPNRVNQASCNTFGIIGNRNLNDNFQEVGLNCSQKISYADSTNWPAIDVIYQVKPTL